VLVCPKCRSIYSTENEFCGIDGHRLIESDEDPLIGLEIDRYKIVSRLGTGAMGYVYLAEHTVLESKRAYKLLFGELGSDKRAMSRFKREAQALSKMRHPNIVTLVDFGTTPEGLTFLAMEYIAGKTLEQILKEDGALGSARSANIVRQMSAGLAEAHKLGFIHRDLKPGNVMLTKFDDTEQVKILDFGLVSIAGEAEPATKITKTGYTLGTPRYLAPEQSQSAEVTFSADLYALGVILYEMIAGRPPFEGDMKTVIMRHLCEAPPPLPPSDGLEALAISLMEKDPAYRPGSAASVVGIVDELAGKIEGSDMFLSLRAVSDPRGSLGPAQASSPPGYMSAPPSYVSMTPSNLSAPPASMQYEVASALTTEQPTPNWNSGATVQPINRTISGIEAPRPPEKLIQNPKKILAFLSLLLVVSGIGFYIASELGTFQVKTAGNRLRPITKSTAAESTDQNKDKDDNEQTDSEPEDTPSVSNTSVDRIEKKVSVASSKSTPRKSRKIAKAKDSFATKTTLDELEEETAENAVSSSKLSQDEIKGLKQELKKALLEKGMRAHELAKIDSTAPLFESWKKAAKQSSKDIKQTHRQLLAVLTDHAVSNQTVQARLKNVHAALVRASEQLSEPEALSKFEEDYLELDSQSRNANSASARQDVASRCLALERKIEKTIRSQAGK